MSKYRQQPKSGTFSGKKAATTDRIVTTEKDFMTMMDSTYNEISAHRSSVVKEVKVHVEDLGRLIESTSATHKSQISAKKGNKIPLMEKELLDALRKLQTLPVINEKAIIENINKKRLEVEKHIAESLSASLTRGDSVDASHATIPSTAAKKQKHT